MLKFLKLFSLLLLFTCVTQSQIFIPFSFWSYPIATLSISDGPTYTYGILPTNADFDKVFTITNSGTYIANNMSGAAFTTTRFTFKGGTYPGTGGTCGVFLSSGSDCTIIVRARSATAATFNDTITIDYSDGRLNTTATRPVNAQFTATTIASLFVLPASGNFQISDTHQLKCYGNTSDGGTIDLTTACGWSSATPATVSVDNTTTKGLITGVANGGPIIITATYAALSGTSSITVSGAVPSFPDTGIGLFARYYTTTSAAGSPSDPYSVLANQRIDASPNFNWAAGSNPAGGVNNYAAIWTGQIIAPTTGAYCVQSRSDDGARLWINNVLIVDRWVDQSATTTNGTFTFTANQKYDIVYEFYENGGDAVAQVLYVAGACGTGAAVPQARLYPTATRALDLQQTTEPQSGSFRRGYALNGTVGAIADGASITAIAGATSTLALTARNTNGTGMAYVSTERSQGVTFDGVDDYMDSATTSLVTGSAARTISAWVKPVDTGADMPVIDYGTTTALRAYGFRILANGRIRHSIQGTTCDSTGSVTFGSYNLVVITLTGTTGRIYINGAPQDSTCTFGGTPNTQTGTLYLGRDVDGTAFYTGELDDVGFWNVVLTAGEVNTLYVRGRVVNPP